MLNSIFKTIIYLAILGLFITQNFRSYLQQMNVENIPLDPVAGSEPATSMSNVNAIYWLNKSY